MFPSFPLNKETQISFAGPKMRTQCMQTVFLNKQGYVVQQGYKFIVRCTPPGPEYQTIVSPF